MKTIFIIVLIVLGSGFCTLNSQTKYTISASSFRGVKYETITSHYSFTDGYEVGFQSIGYTSFETTISKMNFTHSYQNQYISSIKLIFNVSSIDINNILQSIAYAVLPDGNGTDEPGLYASIHGSGYYIGGFLSDDLAKSAVYVDKGKEYITNYVVFASEALSKLPQSSNSFSIGLKPFQGKMKIHWVKAEITYKVPILAVSSVNLDLNPDGSNVNVNITNGGNTDIINYQVTENADWLTVSPMSGNTPGTLTFSATPNYSGQPRTTTVTISGSNANLQSSPKNITVTQQNYIDLVLPSMTVNLNETKSFSSSNSITAGYNGNTFIINGDGSHGGVVNLSAGNLIKLGPGFNAIRGSSFDSHLAGYSQSLALRKDLSGSNEAPKDISLQHDVDLSKPQQIKKEIPKDYLLQQNYPNPFNPVTKISYGLPAGNVVVLKVYNILGKEVALLVNDYQDAGIHTVSFNATGLASGVYFYQLKAGSFAAIKKLILAK